MPDGDARFEEIDFSIDAVLTAVGKHPAGQLFGTLCCFRFSPHRSLTDAVLQVMRVFADILAGQLGRAWNRSIADDEDRYSVKFALRENQPRVVFQSIVDLTSSEIRGFECLSASR